MKLRLNNIKRRNLRGYISTKINWFLNADRIIFLSIASVLIILPLIIVFGYNQTLSLETTIDSTLFGTFGDFFGGTIGSLLSFFGILLFYIALREQRQDFQINSEALDRQIEALDVQINEFQLQRKELEESRAVFKEQAIVLKQQRFENTFFKLIELHHQSLDIELRESINSIYVSLFSSIEHNTTFSEISELTQLYTSLYYDSKEVLATYFKQVYRLLKLIDSAIMNEGEKFEYVKIVRSQLNEPELLILLFNSHTSFGKNFRSLCLTYNLLKHLPVTSTPLFRKTSHIIDSNSEILIHDVTKRNSYRNKIKTQLALFTDFFKNCVISYQAQLAEWTISDSDEDDLEISTPISEHKGYYLHFKASESNELQISILNLNSDVFKIFDLELKQFSSFFESMIIYELMFSRHRSLNAINIIDSSKDANLCLLISLNEKITFNQDLI